MKKLLLRSSVVLITLGGVALLLPRPSDSDRAYPQRSQTSARSEAGNPVGPSPGNPSSSASAEAAPSGKQKRKEPDMQPIQAFNGWLQAYTAATPEERKAMAADGVAMAKTRRPEFQRLIKTNPQLALEIAVRPVVRQDLPEEVLEQLEKPVSARGDYKAYFGRPAPGVTLPPDQELVMRYFETPEGM